MDFYDCRIRDWMKFCHRIRYLKIARDAGGGNWLIFLAGYGIDVVFSFCLGYKRTIWHNSARGNFHRIRDKSQFFSGYGIHRGPLINIFSLALKGFVECSLFIQGLERNFSWILKKVNAAKCAEMVDERRKTIINFGSPIYKFTYLLTLCFFKNH